MTIENIIQNSFIFKCNIDKLIKTKFQLNAIELKNGITIISFIVRKSVIYYDYCCNQHKLIKIKNNTTCVNSNNCILCKHGIYSDQKFKGLNEFYNGQFTNSESIQKIYNLNWNFNLKCTIGNIIYVNYYCKHHPTVLFTTNNRSIKQIRKNCVYCDGGYFGNMTQSVKNQSYINEDFINFKYGTEDIYFSNLKESSKGSAYNTINYTCKLHNYTKKTLVNQLERNTHICRKCSYDSHPGFLNNIVIARNLNKNTFLYLKYFEKDGDKFMKVGLQVDAKRCFSDLGPDIETELLLVYGTLDYLFNIEQKVLENFKNISYIPTKKFKGHTECMLFQDENKKDVIDYIYCFSSI